MRRLVQLGNNSENTIEPQALATQNLANMWLELVDPTEDEIKAVSDASALPASFLRLPTKGVVNLRLEMGFSVIEFVVMKDVVETKASYPVILAFCKDFLVTIAPKESEGIINTAKERMSKTK